MYACHFTLIKAHKMYKNTIVLISITEVKKFQYVCAQLCLPLCDLTDCSPPGSSVHGISQTRILEWIAIPSPGVLPDPGIKPKSPALQADSLPLAPRTWVDPWVGKIPWRRAWQPTLVVLPGESNGQRSLEGYSP